MNFSIHSSIPVFPIFMLYFLPITRLNNQEKYAEYQSQPVADLIFLKAGYQVNTLPSPLTALVSEDITTARFGIMNSMVNFAMSFTALGENSSMFCDFSTV
jgi:hypothetical protein